MTTHEDYQTFDGFPLARKQTSQQDGKLAYTEGTDRLQGGDSERGNVRQALRAGRGRWGRRAGLARWNRPTHEKGPQSSR